MVSSSGRVRPGEGEPVDGLLSVVGPFGVMPLLAVGLPPGWLLLANELGPGLAPGLPGPPQPV